MKTNHILGFTSFEDFLSSFLGLKNAIIHFFFAFFFALSTFFSDWVYSEAEPVFVLCFLYFLDVVSGLAKSVSIKHKHNPDRAFIMNFIYAINSSKLMRSFVSLTAAIALLSASYWIGKNSTLFIWLPGLVLGGLYSTQFISILENLNEAGLIKASFVSWIKEKIGKKFLNKD